MQAFVQAGTKELNRTPSRRRRFRLWWIGRVGEGILNDLEATANEGGDLGVAVAALHRGDQEQVEVRAKGGASRFWGALQGDDRA